MYLLALSWYCCASTRNSGDQPRLHSRPIDYIFFETLRFRYILEHRDEPLRKMDADRLAQFNPLLAEINPVARLAYAKFKMHLLKRDYEGLRHLSVDMDQPNASE